MRLLNIAEFKDHLQAAPQDGRALRETGKHGPAKLGGSEDKSDRGVACTAAMRREDERVDQALFGSRLRSLRVSSMPQNGSVDMK